MAKTKLRIGSRLDLGQVRDNQEDSLRIYLPEQQVVQEEKGALFIVADGVGGHQAGDVASAFATEVLTNAYYASASHNVEDALREAVAAANTHIYQEAQARASQAGMGSTCVVVALRGNHIGVANVGDSRAYILRGGKLTQISQDHSWVADQVRSGQLSQEEAHASQFRNVLTQALGSGEQVEPSVRGQNLRASDVILLCSDGLTTMLDDDEIAAFIAQYDDPQEACNMLVEAANHRGGKDNISIIIVRIDALQGSNAEDAHAASESAAATAIHPVKAEAMPAAAAPTLTTAPLSPAARNAPARRASSARPPSFAAPTAVEQPAVRPSRWPLALLVIAIFAILAALYFVFQNQIDPLLNSVGSSVGLGAGQLDPIIGGIGLLLMLLLIMLLVRGGQPTRAARDKAAASGRDSSRPYNSVTTQQDAASVGAQFAPSATLHTSPAPAIETQPIAPARADNGSPLASRSVSTLTVSFPFGHEAYDVAAVVGDDGSEAIGSCVLSAPATLLGSVDELGKPASRGFWLTLYDRSSGESTVAVLLSPRAYEQEWSAVTASLPQDPMVRFAEIRRIQPGLHFQLSAGQLQAEVSVLECHYLVAGRQRTPDRYLDQLTLRCDVTYRPSTELM